MYDFYEFLGRGIIAARTGRRAEALKYLDIAKKIEPSNPRVWLWLAACKETLTQKRDCLEKALELDPNLLVAKAMLNRLDLKENFTHLSSGEFKIFTCKNCGGKQRFDPDRLALVCDYCQQVELLAVENASNAEVDLESALNAGSGNWAILAGEIECRGCGARLTIPADRSTTACPFCQSDQVTLRPATPGLELPNGIAPFKVHADDLREILNQRKGGFFSMSSRADAAHGQKIDWSAIYLPFWTFDGRVQIRCALDYRIPVAEYSNSERVILKGDWPMEKSWYECDIDDLCVYAGRILDNKSILPIEPFDLKSVVEYSPAMLAGWQGELYQIALEDAAVEAHKRMRDIAFHAASHRMLFIEPAHLLQEDVLVLDKTFKLVLLPVWIVRVTQGGKILRALVNGQTGNGWN
jgi:hypothetical protein